MISGEEGIGVGGGDGEERVDEVGAGENRPDRRRGGGGSELCTRPARQLSPRSDLPRREAPTPLIGENTGGTNKVVFLDQKEIGKVARLVKDRDARSGQWSRDVAQVGRV